MAKVEKVRQGQAALADLPEPVSGDAEVNVTRQRGPSWEAAAAADPFLDMPVVQTDPETLVTRQEGTYTNDAQTGVLQADHPVGTGDSSGLIVSDRMAEANADLGFPDFKGVVPGVPLVEIDGPAPNDPKFPAVAGAEVDVTRQQHSPGTIEKGAAQGSVGDVFVADRSAPGVQMAETGGRQQFTKEQLEAFKAGRPYASDKAGAEGQVIVHDPVKAMAEMAEASIKSHPASDRMAKARAAKAAKTSSKAGRPKSKAAEKAPEPEPAPVQRQAPGDNGPGHDASNPPVVDL